MAYLQFKKELNNQSKEQGKKVNLTPAVKRKPTLADEDPDVEPDGQEVPNSPQPSVTGKVSNKKRVSHATVIQGKRGGGGGGPIRQQDFTKTFSTLPS